MTTSVKTTAHCSSDKEVVIEVRDGDKVVETAVLNDGEWAEHYAYDARTITSYERVKGS